MKTLKIGLVEDEALIADNISEMLTGYGYEVTAAARKYSEAIDMIEEEEPDLLLIDVRIIGKLDGIDVAQTVQEKYSMPYIFLTANSDFDTISRAKALRPSAFLTKPVTAPQLYAAVEMAIAAFSTQQDTANISEQKKSEFLFVKEGPGFHKLAYDEIAYAESVENYVRLYLTNGKSVLMRSTFTDFLEEHAGTGLVKIHRRYAIAPKAVRNVLSDDVILTIDADNSATLPVSRSCRDALLKILGIKA